MEGRAQGLGYPPAGNGRIAVPRIAADAMTAAGAVLLAASLPLIALRFLSLKPGLFPFMVAGTAVGIFLLRRPEWIVPGYVALVWTSIDAAYFGGLPSPIEVGGLILLGYATWQATQRIGYASEVLVVCSLFALPVLASGVASPGGIIVPIADLKAIIFLFLAALTVRRVADVERAAVTLSGIGIFLGLGALSSVFLQPTRLFPLRAPEFDFQDPELRAAGPIGDPNFFALILAVLLPFALYLIARGGKRQWVGLAAFLVLLGGVFATGSRGGLVAVAFAILAMGMVIPVPRLRIAAAAVVVGTFIALPVFAAQTKDAAARQNEGRLTENLVAVVMFADYPVSGVGPTRFEDHYRDYTRDIGNDPRAVREAHSLPLEIAAEQGLAGVIGWLVALLTVIRFALARGVWRLMIGRAVMISIGTFLIASMFLHGDTLRILFMLLGMLLALGYAASQGDRESQPA